MTFLTAPQTVMEVINESESQGYGKRSRCQLYVFHVGALKNVLYFYDKPKMHIYKYVQ